MTQTNENCDQRLPRTDGEILDDVHRELQDWHDEHHGITFMDVCPYPPCRLLPVEFTRRRP